MLAVPCGLFMGYGLSWLTARATESELFRLPEVLPPLELEARAERFRAETAEVDVVEHQ